MKALTALVSSGKIDNPHLLPSPHSEHAEQKAPQMQQGIVQEMVGKKNGKEKYTSHSFDCITSNVLYFVIVSSNTQKITPMIHLNYSNII